MQYLIDCILAVTLHEFGHLLGAVFFGIRIKRFGLSLKGPYIVREKGDPYANICVALAGPIVNLALGLTYWSTAREFAVINFVLGISNILPIIPGCDGQHALAAYRKLKLVQRRS